MENNKDNIIDLKNFVGFLVLEDLLTPSLGIKGGVGIILFFSLSATSGSDHE
jgi:hypothetical protein